MAGRHRPRGTRHRPRRQTRALLVIAGTALLVTSTVLVMQNLAGAGGCSAANGVRLGVAADPAIAPVLRQVAADWTSSREPQINGRCVAVEVSQAPTADVAQALATASGGFLDAAAGASPAPPESLPAVWVPDSSYWITRMRAISRSLFEPDNPSLATSPIALAVTPDRARVLGEGPVPVAALREPLLATVAATQQGEPPPLRLALPEPRRDTAGLVGAAWIQSAVVATDDDLPLIVALFRAQRGAPQDTAALLPTFDDGVQIAPMSEQAVIHYNSTTPPTPVTAVRVEDAPALDFPYAVLGQQPRDVRIAASMFLDALARATDVFTRHGFRAPDGAARGGFPTGNGVTTDPAPATAVGPPERFDQARRIWTSATSDARVLSVVGVNASMGLPMSTAQGPVPRIEIFRAAARQGVELFTDGTDLGHWEYAARLDGDRDWREGMPIALLTEEHTARIMRAIDRAQPVATNEAAMFETLLAAYQAMKDGWDPARSNTLVVWTDGGDPKPGGLTLGETLRELERMRDLTRPIRVVLQGLGPDVNMADLEALAEATGGVAFHITDPDQIQMVFLRALLALPPVTPR